jgi:Nucleotide-diphospho-sugar transferase
MLIPVLCILILAYLPQRLFRSHLGDKRNSYSYHPSELSVSPWPFSFWQAYRQSPWMILSKGAIEFLRTDVMALNFLAFVEHAYNPEETYFATGKPNINLVLANSPSQNTKLVQDKKRYAREAGSGAWCGWKDHEMFPPGSSAFFFFRPFNLYGTYFGEDKLAIWVKQKHLDQSILKPCLVGELGSRDECLRELAAETAFNNGLILIPVGSKFIPMVANLRCSLTRQGIANIIFWSFEASVHKQVMAQGLLSYYDPAYEVTPPPEKFHQQDPQFVKIMRHKPTILLKLLNAGFDAWYIDADVVATRDFRLRSSDYTNPPFDADVILTVSEAMLITPTKAVLKPPSPDSGIMFFRSTEKSKMFLENVEDRIAASFALDEDLALSQAVVQASDVTWTGIGTKARTIIYPDGKNEASRRRVSCSRA